jgi:hypothetical protein
VKSVTFEREYMVTVVRNEVAKARTAVQGNEELTQVELRKVFGSSEFITINMEPGVRVQRVRIMKEKKSGATFVLILRKLSRDNTIDIKRIEDGQVTQSYTLNMAGFSQVTGRVLQLTDFQPLTRVLQTNELVRAPASEDWLTFNFEDTLITLLTVNDFLMQSKEFNPDHSESIRTVDLSQQYQDYQKQVKVFELFQTDIYYHPNLNKEVIILTKRSNQVESYPHEIEIVDFYSGTSQYSQQLQIPNEILGTGHGHWRNSGLGFRGE